MATESVHACFKENITLTTVINSGSVFQWYTERNRVCKELGLGREHCNSVPLKMPKDQIRSFFKEFETKSEEWKAMKLVVLGNGRIGKSTLVHKLKDHVKSV